MQSVCLVVPCYNEALRLDADAFLDGLATRPWLSIHFVDDGSTDATATVLENLCARHPRATYESLPANAGKAEAVRVGLAAVGTRTVEYLGYWDADLATPLPELDAMREEAERTDALMLLGSRVKLLGREIQRSPARHYVGRVFATLASVSLRLPVYDTQCGAKILKNSEQTRTAIRAPFRTRWVFDVELIARLAHACADAIFVEYPIRQWKDVAGSKVRLRDGLRAGWDLLRLGYRVRFRPQQL